MYSYFGDTTLEVLLLAPDRSTLRYARRSRGSTVLAEVLASAQNPLPRMHSYFGDTTPGFRSPYSGPLLWGEGESSAVFRPYPRRSLPGQCALNIDLAAAVPSPRGRASR